MFGAIWRWIKRTYFNFSNDLAEAIDTGNTGNIIFNVVYGILAVTIAGGIVVLLTYAVILNIDFLIAWIGVPILVVYMLVHWIRNATSSHPPIDSPPQVVEEELLRQRAREQYDELLMLMFNSIQGTAGITPLVRPNDMFDVQTSAPTGDHFYLKQGIPIFQFECDVETPLDKTQLDILQRELQRHTHKQVSRFPLLISSEAQGRAPVEVLDVKNCGGHILLDIVLTTTASIPMIEARRRARVERQQKNASIYDNDF